MTWSNRVAAAARVTLLGAAMWVRYRRTRPHRLTRRERSVLLAQVMCQTWTSISSSDRFSDVSCSRGML